MMHTVERARTKPNAQRAETLSKTVRHLSVERVRVKPEGVSTRFPRLLIGIRRLDTRIASKESKKLELSVLH